MKNLINRFTRISEWSISIKIIVLFSVISFTSIIIIGWYGFDTAKSALSEEHSNALENDVNEISIHLDDLLSERISSIKLIAKIDSIENFSLNWPYVSKELEMEAQEVIENLNNSNAYFHSVYIMNREGDVILSTADNVGDNYSFRTYFFQAMDGKAYISDISISVDAGIPVMYFSAPIQGEDGKVNGVSLLRVKAEEIWDFINIKERHVLKESKTMIIDQYGMVIADSNNQELVFKTITPLDQNTKEQILEGHRLGLLEEIESINYQDLANKLGTIKDEPNFTYNIDNGLSPYIASASTMNNKPWTVINSIPEDIYVSKINKIKSATIITGGMVAIYTILATIFIGEMITSPMKKVIDSVNRIAEGELDHSLDYLGIKSHDEIGTLINSVTIMQSNILNSFNELNKSYMDTIGALSTALETRDWDTHGHSQRVTDMSLRIGKEIGLDPDEHQSLMFGALLHDVGKIGISDSILLKPGPLNDHEWEIMKTHNEIGYKIVSNIENLKGSLPVILHHHEKYDGSGYPNGLSGDDIPLIARIFSIADAYDAMTSDRPYKKGKSHEEALAEIKKTSGKHFDPQLVEVFLEIYSQG